MEIAMSQNNAVVKSSQSRVMDLSGGRELRFERPLVMGILNATPDSFSDGGKFPDVASAIAEALTMVRDGADIVDIGGESTRPGAQPVAADEELRRVIPIIDAFRAESDIPVSIDTSKAEVAAAALDAGADIVNDVTALRGDPKMADLVAKTGVPVVLMHMLGEPGTMQNSPTYDDCVAEVLAFLRERVAFAVAAGVERNRVIIDPGIGFGKRLEDNLALLANLSRFASLDLPVLVGASRKRFIGAIHPSRHDAVDRLGGSLAAALAAAGAGANILRVHDVAATVEALKVAGAIRDAGGKR
jgi:dihydropteroate synthase